MKWITRERPKIDRVACPWLIARFIDKEPEFLFVPPAGSPVDDVYNMSTHNRAASLIQYINDHQFDVVALSEMFNPEAQDLLGRSLPPAYDKGVMIGRIDTAGDHFERGGAFGGRHGIHFGAHGGMIVARRRGCHRNVPSPRLGPLAFSTA